MTKIFLVPASAETPIWDFCHSNLFRNSKFDIRISRLLCSFHFLMRFFRGRYDFPNINDYTCWTFIHSGFGLFSRLVSLVTYAGQIILNDEHIGLLGTQAAADTADLAHRPCYLAGLFIAARNRHHILIPERRHHNQIAWARLRAGRAAGTLTVINRSKAFDNVKGAELARLRAVAES